MKKLLFILFLLPVLTFAQTKNIVPNAGHEGSVGTSANGLYWLNGYFDHINDLHPEDWMLKNDSSGVGGSGAVGKYATGKGLQSHVGLTTTAHGGIMASNATVFNGVTIAPEATGFRLTGGTSPVALYVDVSGAVSAFVAGEAVPLANAVTSVAALTLGTTGTDLSSTVANGTTTPVITLQVPTASASNRGALSSTDWSTFNGKQAALTNPITGTGTTNELSYWASASTHGSLAVATYPSLTELAYVKGVTSAVQTQISAKAPTASPTFTGTVTLPTVALGEASLQLNPTLSATGTWSGITETGTAGATLAFGNVCYFDGATSKWKLAKSDVVATSAGLLGMCVLAANADAATEMLLIGKIRFTSFPTLAPGAPNYISAATAGAVVAGAIGATTNQPAATDNVIRVIGHSKTADVLYFNPSSDYITHN